MRSLIYGLVGVVLLMLMLYVSILRRQNDSLKRELNTNKRKYEMLLSVQEIKLNIIRLENERNEVYDVISNSDRVYRDSIRSAVFERYMYLLHQ